jgi:Fur family ferric uptake transcriptional regulator
MKAKSAKAHDHVHEVPDAKLLMTRLKDAKLSLTPTRLGILELLTESHRVWSIEQLLEALKKKAKPAKGSLVFTTVYRCLLKLEEAGLVRAADLGDGISRYEYNTCDEHHHHHVVCKQCGSIEALDDCDVVILENAVKKMGYQQINHRLEFSGVCKSCQKKSA